MKTTGRGLFFGGALAVAGCLAPDASRDTPLAVSTDGARRVAERIEALRDSPTELEAYLRAMPKGADLHTHLSGAVYAESYLRWAHEDGLCVNPESLALLSPSQCGTADAVPVPTSPAAPLYQALVRDWSMEGFTPGAESGHDHFFATFAKFSRLSTTRTGEMMAEVVGRASENNELYVELMLGLTAGAAGAIGDRVWTSATEPTLEDLSSFHDALVADPDWEGVIASTSPRINANESRMRATLGCDAGRPETPPGCEVTLRYLFQTSRTSAPQQLFAQLVAAFQVAARDPRVVGMNLVSPEDNRIALRDYELQMQMIDFLHRRYVQTGESPLRIALHAGELTKAVLPADQQHHLRFHVRRAVQVGHAERIGHGVDIEEEDDSASLRAELAARGVLVEVCLSSNLGILEVTGDTHPLDELRRDRVPTAIATDDEGVSRSNMTKEYVRAIRDQGLGYRELKTMARQSLEHAFLPGASLFRSIEDGQPTPACEGSSLGIADPGASCRRLLAASERARLQWAVEARFTAFESAP